jgi:hypothetical protein
MNKHTKNIPLNLLKTDLNRKLNKPVLFNKKENKVLNRPLIIRKTFLGKSKHFTPASQEWYNSIYTYNNNYTKYLSIADKNLINLLRNYFNFQSKMNKSLKVTFKNKHKSVFKNRNNLELKFNSKDMRMSTKKIFVGKGYLKHTSSKVLITFFIYNAEGMFLFNRFERLWTLLINPKFSLKEFINTNPNNKRKRRIFYNNRKITLASNRVFTLLEFKYLCSLYLYYYYTLRQVTKITRKINKINEFINIFNGLMKRKIINKDEKNLFIKNLILNINFNALNYTNIQNIYKYKDGYNKFSDLLQRIYIKKLYKNYLLLKYNKIKFSNNFLSRLIFYIKKLYNKEVELNIVNLKKMHLNSDIFTQIVSLKLRNRNNKLFKVLKSSLRKIKLPIFRKIDEKKSVSDRNKLLINNQENNNRFISTNYTNSLKYSTLNNLKHIDVRGVRIEAKGRLTRRFTASRSVFKMKYKGGLRHAKSSFGGFPAIMVRGIVKSNIQYSLINSKSRNGAFGVKGWISSK